MGLDLIVEGTARQGHETEWRRIVERVFAGEPISDADTERYQEISIPSYDQVGAPRVGYDAAADAWIVEVRGARTPEEKAEVIEQFRGHCALPLVKSDGLPKYTHANLYDGVDETSFRGAALQQCNTVLSGELIGQAWNHKFAEDAIAYGRALLAAADSAEVAGPPPSPSAEPEPEPAKGGFLARLLGQRRQPKIAPLGWEEQLELVRAAGRWFLFWGERGNAIRAWS